MPGWSLPHNANGRVGRPDCAPAASVATPVRIGVGVAGTFIVAIRSGVEECAVALPSTSSTRKITAAPFNRWRGIAGAAVDELVELAVPAHGVAAGAVAARVAAAAANRGGGVAGVKLNVGTRRAGLLPFCYPTH